MADKPGFSSHETSSRENGEEIPIIDIRSSNEIRFSYHMEAGTASKIFKGWLQPPAYRFSLLWIEHLG